MKKVIILFVTAVMIFSLVSCQEKVVKEESFSNDNKQETINNSDTEAQSDTEETAQDNEEPDTALNNIHGYVQDGFYANEYLKIACEIPQGWDYYSDEQLLELIGNTEEIIGDSFDFENADYFYDFASFDTEYGDNINIVIQKVGEEKLNSLTVESYLKSYKSTMETTLSNSGYENVQVEISETEFLGESVPCYRISSDLNNVEVYQTQVAIISGDYLVSFTATSYYEDISPEIISIFFAF